MKYSRFASALGAACILGVMSTALPAIASVRAAGGHTHLQADASAPFVFGRAGGNIRPFTVTITANGQITMNGPVSSTGNRPHLSAAAIKGLLKLARAERFFNLPDQIEGARVLPDVASLFITVTSNGTTKTVRLHGGHSSAFEQLFAVLMAVAGASY